MYKKFITTLIITLSTFSLLGSGVIIRPAVADAASDTGKVQLLSTTTSDDLQSVFNIFSEVADIIGVEEQTVMDKMASGSSLVNIAESNNISESALLEMLCDRAEARINSALADNTITAAEVSNMKTYMPVMFKLLVENKYFSSDKMLDAPKSLTAISLNLTTITLNWNSVSKATSYYIYRSTSTYGAYKRLATVKTTSYTDKSAVKGMTYYYKVKAISSSGTSPYSSPLKATVGSNFSSSGSSLSVPGNVTATAASDTKITIKWSSVTNATYYYIYRATSSTGTYSKAGSSTATSYTDTSLSAGTTYYYKVIALNNSSESGYSSVASSTTDASFDLDTPDDLDITDYSEDEITLEWDEVDDADGYYVYRATSKSGTYSKIDTVYDTEYTDYDVSDDTTYYYKVKAYNGDGTSEYSVIVYATTDDSDNDLDAPDDLDIIDVSDDEITLVWDEVDDADGYYVYRSTSRSGTYTKLDSVDDTEYTDYDLSDDTTYYYKVKAYNDDGTSEYSSVVYTTTDSDDLDEPDDLDVTDVSDDSITLEWDEVDNADGYYVYRAKSKSGTYTKLDSVDYNEYTDYDLSDDTTYYYKVKAYNDDDTSDYSAIVHATTDED
ncbi:MAG: fibronectin type III domain-containing protein [Anaerocolumna sp.]